MPPNKELKLTKPCAIGASQLNSSVVRTPRASEGTVASNGPRYCCGERNPSELTNWHVRWIMSPAGG
jgi:hypothetical protein